VNGMRRIRTFVSGLDELLEGGVPGGSIVMISGAPGTMKTSLAFNILHQNAVRGIRGLYISLEQRRESLLDQAGGLGLRVEDTKGNLSVLDLAALRKKLGGEKDQPWLDLLKLYAQGIKTSFGFRLLVLDSLDALEILARFGDVRRELFDLIKWLRGLECTTLLLTELPTTLSPTAPPNAFAKHKEEYLADGIIHLRLAKQGEFGVQRQLRVAKMRGTRHDTSYHALIFEDGFKLTQVLG